MASPRLTEPSAIPPGLSHGEIREQLERILTSGVFRNSKRNSSLLRHVVERALESHPEELKERNIGVDVFGRNADYDTNTDHVVRSVAGEVRRRLAQYYMETGHEGEIRIDLLSGSYVPQFRSPAEPVPVIGPRAASRRVAWQSPLMLGTLALLLAAGAGSAVWLASPASAFDRFWKPFLESPNIGLLCVGGGGQAVAALDPATTSIIDFERQPARRMHTSDALALVGVAGMLQASHKPYRILNRAGATSFRDLQSGPFVLIGGMNNEWTLRLTSGLRFGFDRQQGKPSRVIDHKNPGKTDWSMSYQGPLAELTKDYAIVSRMRDPETEQAAVIVAGIGSWGTLAASEFVTKPEHLKKLEAFAPANWEKMNLQVVISTDVIRGSSGPPNVLAAYFW